MRWEPRRHLPLLVGLSVLVAAIALVLPWWTVEVQSGSASGQATVAPFSPGQAEGAVQEGAVTAVGVLDFVGIVGLIGGLVVALRSSTEDEDQLAGYLWLGSGGFLLVAALTAVLTWPEADTGFWGSASAGGAGVSAAASAGWYLTVLAGAIAAVVGFAWLLGAGSTDEPTPPA